MRRMHLSTSSLCSSARLLTCPSLNSSSLGTATNKVATKVDTQIFATGFSAFLVRPPRTAEGATGRRITPQNVVDVGEDGRERDATRR